MNEIRRKEKKLNSKIETYHYFFAFNQLWQISVNDSSKKTCEFLWICCNHRNRTSNSVGFQKIISIRIGTLRTLRFALWDFY